MNERIRQLADEAAKYSAVMALPTGQSGNELFVEKFTELIVRECLEQFQYTVLDTQELRRDKSTDYQVGWEDGMFDAGETIKYIFGVEE
jgi:hypothetical protein